MQFDGFDWDDGNWPKCGKHGVSKAEIEGAFVQREIAVLRDAAHSDGEDRYLLILRQTGEHHGLLVGFTIRRRHLQQLIRPITARYMHKKEVDNYE